MDEKKIEYIRSRKSPINVWDIVLFVVAAILVVVLCSTLFRKTGESVEIATQNARIILSLQENARRRVDEHLTVVIENGKVWVEDSDCKNLVCVKTGKISHVGESIVCAQNRIVITVIGNTDLAGSVGQG